MIGRDPRDAISSRAGRAASGGGVHSVTSAMATEWRSLRPASLGSSFEHDLAPRVPLRPPAASHLLAGPDYSAMAWARRTHLCSRKRNGRPPIALPSTAIRRWGRSWRTLSPLTGKLYLEGPMTGGREAYVLICGNTRTTDDRPGA